MNLSFKKISMVTVLFTATAFAAIGLSKENVNAKVAELLQPFNNKTTIAKLFFTDLVVNNERALDFGLTALYEKVGTQNKLTIDIPKVSYQYGDGTSPTVRADVFLGLDLIKAYGQDTVNEFAKDIEATLQDIAQSFGEKYGDALSVKVQVLEMNKTDNGDVISAKFSIDLIVDFSKITDPDQLTDLEIQSASAIISAAQTGIGAHLSFVMNPKYAGFANDGAGLKEYIDELISGESDRYAEIQMIFNMLDDSAKELVNAEK